MLAHTNSTQREPFLPLSVVICLYLPSNSGFPAKAVLAPVYASPPIAVNRPALAPSHPWGRCLPRPPVFPFSRLSPPASRFRRSLSIAECGVVRPGRWHRLPACVHDTINHGLEARATEPPGTNPGQPRQAPPTEEGRDPSGVPLRRDAALCPP